MSASRRDWCGAVAAFWTPLDLAGLVVMPSCADHLPHATETQSDVTACYAPRDLAAALPSGESCAAWRRSARRAWVRVDRWRPDRAPWPRAAFERFTWTLPDGRVVRAPSRGEAPSAPEDAAKIDRAKAGERLPKT